MNLGINQLALLKRCYQKKEITIRDVTIYYRIPMDTKDNEQRLLAILEKLELRGFLRKTSYAYPIGFTLTNLGKIIVEENTNIKSKMGVNN